MSEWEYRVVLINTEYIVDSGGNIDNSPSGDEIISKCLNALGRDGWEACGFIPASPGKHFIRGGFQNPWMFYGILKRPIEKTEERIRTEAESKREQERLAMKGRLPLPE